MPFPGGLGRSFAVLLAGALLLAALAIARPAAASTAHGPIRIEGNAGFTAANGVISGSGSIADPYVIAGWDIDATSDDGLVVRNTTAAFLVRDVSVHSGGLAHNGILFENVTSARVENSTVSHDASGIVLHASSDIVLRGNAVTINTWDGIAIFDSHDITLNGNNVTYNRDGLYVQGIRGLLLQGNGLWLNSQDGAFLTNVTDVRIEGTTFSSNAWVGLHLGVGSNVTAIVNVAFSNGRDGISIESATNLQLRTNNAFSNLGGGIRLYSVTNATVTYNDVSANRDSGIVLESSHSVALIQNFVSGSGYSGIVLSDDTDLTVVGNWVSNSDLGLSLILVSRATLRYNNITMSRETGIYFAGSDNITVDANNASGNANGIAVESTVDGVFRGNEISHNNYGIYLFRSYRIIVAGNQIESNAVQAFDEAGPANRWDDGYPAGGNFWADYHGVDQCSGPNQTVCTHPDGIGDTPYSVYTDSEDRYPLMWPPGSTNAALVAAFTIEPPIGKTTTHFMFDASGSYDIQDASEVLEFRWDFNGDGIWDTSWSYNRTVMHDYPDLGNYLVRLEVRDSGGVTNVTVRGLTVGAAPVPPSLFSIDAVTASWLLLAGAIAVFGAVSTYRKRWRIRRIVTAKIARFRSKGRN